MKHFAVRQTHDTSALLRRTRGYLVSRLHLGSRSARYAIGWVDLLAFEAIANAQIKIAAFRIGGEELTVLLRRDVKVAIYRAVAELQIKLPLAGRICGRS